MATFRTRSELRLEELEALRRPLTKPESDDLRRCLHAIYMRHWRLANAVTGCGGELMEVQKRATVETNAIAYRMEGTFQDYWPAPRFDDWQDKVRTASDQLRDAILAAQVRAAA